MSSVIKGSSRQASSIRSLPLDNGLAPHGRGPYGQPASSAVEKILRQAEQTLNEARRHGAEIERESYQRGFSQGEKAGMALGQQKFEPLLKRFSQLVEELSALRERLLAANEKFILQMGFLAAAEILHAEITHRDEAVLSSVRAALEKVVRGAGLRLLVSPYDYKLVQAHLPELLTRLVNREDFRLEADAEVARGGCFLKTEVGDIDAQIDNQLAILRQRLLSED